MSRRYPDDLSLFSVGAVLRGFGVSFLVGVGVGMLFGWWLL